MSIARQVFSALQGKPLPFIGAYPAPCSVSGSNYSVSYFSDNSILICVDGKAYHVLDEPKTYYRQDVEHAARCLGVFGPAKIAEMLRHKYEGQEAAWIDGVQWSVATGELLDVS